MTVFRWLIGFVIVTATAFAQQPARMEPGPKAKPHEVYEWTSKGGLRFTWCVPKGYDRGDPRRLVVICHGTGLDYRWGHANHKAGVFRPDDVVVSVDGPSKGGNDSRLFLGEPADVKATKAFLDELRAWFRVSSLFLYGHSQGGFFVTYFAGAHPDAVDGVVAHASGSWTHVKISAELKALPIVFMHGTGDPVVPYRQSVGSRDHFKSTGFRTVHLRRLPYYNHWPNGMRTSECITWCDGMSTGDPARVLEAARELLRGKGADEYQYEMAPDYAGARALLRRFDEKSTHPLKADEKARAEAAKLALKIEDDGREHVEAVKRSMPAKKPWKLDDKAWIGYLAALREDFAGVDSVEQFLSSIEYDKVVKEQGKSASKLLDFWYDDRADAATRYRGIAAELQRAFLVDGLPADLAGGMERWEKDAVKRELSKKDLAAGTAVKTWRDAWSNGLKEYTKVWKKHL